MRTALSAYYDGHAVVIDRIGDTDDRLRTVCADVALCQDAEVALGPRQLVMNMSDFVDRQYQQLPRGEMGLDGPVGGMLKVRAKIEP